MRSDRNNHNQPNDPRLRDGGFTLPELLVTLTVMAMILVALSSAIIVTLRTESSSQGRLNVARSEQSVDAWLPADLASTDSVDTSAGAMPCSGNCPAGIDLSGSNAILLRWVTNQVAPDGTVAEAVTSVSYRVRSTASEWQLVRIECVEAAGISCNEIVILHDLPDPKPEFVPFEDGVTEPGWVITVGDALAACAVDEDNNCVDPADAADESDDGIAGGVIQDPSRVVVTIDGGGTGDGRGGGLNQITITAGGARKGSLEPTELTGAPSLVEARSRCGGPIALLIDVSRSVDDAGATADVRLAVNSFVDAFENTPTELMLIRFANKTDVIGSNSWHNYYDMLDSGDVSALRAGIDTNSDFRGTSLGLGTGTDWEDAMFRAVFERDLDDEGDPVLAAKQPGMTVLFTDGLPTVHRVMTAYGFGPSDVRGAGDGTLGGLPSTPAARGGSPSSSSFDQEAFDRANHLSPDLAAATRFIGVGVGGINGSTSYWSPNGVRQNKPAAEILARVVSGTDSGIPYTPSTPNEDQANMYIVSDWSQLQGAMQTVALSECGGTLTVQTRTDSGNAPSSSFTYQNTDQWVPPATRLDVEPTIVTTSTTFNAGTFDFDTGVHGSIIVRIAPQNLSDLLNYAPASTPWSCRAGPNSHPSTLVDIDGSPFKAIDVVVQPNAPVSCTMHVVGS